MWPELDPQPCKRVTQTTPHLASPLKPHFHPGCVTMLCSYLQGGGVFRFQNHLETGLWLGDPQTQVIIQGPLQ